MARVLEASIESFYYPRSRESVLKPIDLKIEEGEFVVITGPAGAGKTTLCNCLTGVIPKFVNGEYRGRVTIQGRPLDQISLPQIASLAGFVLQTPENQLFSPSVFEDVAFGPENLGIPAEEIERRAWESLSFVGMDAYAHRLSDALSGGQTQRVALSCILALAPPIFILDQPAAELDPRGRRELYENIFQLNRKAGKTIVVVEDKLSDVVAYATRIILMKDGAIIRDQEPRVFFESQDVFSYGIRVPDAVRLYHLMKERSICPPKVFLTAEEVSENFTPLLEASQRQDFGTGTGRRDLQTGATESFRNEVPPRADGRHVVIEVQDLHYSYPSKNWALKGINLTIREGEFVAFVGENGAGKTTLAKQLNGLRRPTKGRVLINGHDARKMSIAQLSDQVGFLFQNPDYQIFSESAFAEVAFGLKIRKVPQSEIETRVVEILDRLGLADFRNHHPYLLSRAQRQRLAFASVLVRKPPILVVDEPSTGMDFAETIGIMDLLSEYRQQGGTVIIITHDMEMVVRYAERCIVMAGGNVYVDTATSRMEEHFEMLHEASIRLPDLYYLVEALNLPPSVNSVEQVASIISTSSAKVFDKRF